MKIERRPATNADIPLLYEICRLAMREHVIENFGEWNELEQAEEFEKTTDIYFHEMLLDGGQPFGFINVVSQNDRVHLNRLCIIPEYQSRGIGTRIIEGLIKRTDPAAVITLQVFPKNPAYRLYCRLGFKKTKTTATHIHMVYGGVI